MRARLVFVLLALLAVATISTPVSAKLLALVVGNNAYEEVPQLQTAVNDAQAMRDALQRAGFTVTLVENGSKRQISRAMAAVENAISPGDTVLFHYSGHGVEIDGQNWLLPIDVPAAKEGEAGLIKDESFNAADIIDRFRAKGARQVVAILDACRNNPFSAGGTRALPATRGLARMEADGGVFIMFSAGSKQEAMDSLSPSDPEKTSVFVRSFLPLLGRQDMTLIDMAKETQEKVRSLARGAGREQVPAYYDGIVGRVTLTGEQPAAPAARTQPASTPAAPTSFGGNASENLFWQSIQSSSDPAMFQAYLDQVQAGTFNGTYKVLAQIKLAALQPKPASPPPAAEPSAPKPQQQAALPAAPAPKSEDANPDIAACDKAAADPRDPSWEGAAPASGLDAASAPAAIAACSKAIATPDPPGRSYYQLARAYLMNGQEALAMAQLQKAASLLYPAAMFELGNRYAAGRGVPKDAMKALGYYYKTVGVYPAAYSKVAWMYANGIGASRDYRKAAVIYQLGIDAKDTSAYAGLGGLYRKGLGVPKDGKKACDLFKQGAAAGDAEAADLANQCS